MADKKKKKKQPSHVGLASKMKSQKDYKNYVIGGGSSDYATWQKENK